MGIFSSGRKSPKDKKDKTPPSKEGSTEKDQKNRGSPTKDSGKGPAAVVIVKDGAQNQGDNKNAPLGHTKPYEYDRNEDSPTRKTYIPGGFRYDDDPQNAANRSSANDDQMSPTSQARRATGTAFNYAPGDDKKLIEEAEKRKTGLELSPRTRDKLAKGELSPRTRQKLLNDANLSPKSRQRLLDLEAVPFPIGFRASYSPNNEKPAAVANDKVAPGTAGSYKPLVDPNAAFIEGEKYDKGQLPGVLAGGVNVPRKKKVKIMVVISRLDPKTKRIDPVDGEVEHSTGILDTETGKIETKYGVIDPKKGTVETLDPRTGKMETFQGQVDAKSKNIYLTSGVVNRKTGAMDDGLGQIICVAPIDNPSVEITAITGKVDPATGIVDTVNGDVERTKGVMNLQTGFIDTKYGHINPKTGEVRTVDPKSGKVSTKTATVDPNNGQLTVVGVVDPKTNKVDPNLAHMIAIGSQIDPMIEVTAVNGKVDKKGLIDPKTATVDLSTGQYDSDTGKIDTKFGQIDLTKHTITFVDPKTGKTEVKDIKIDPVTGQILLKNQVNPKTGKPEKDFGKLISIRIVNSKLDPASGKLIPTADTKDAVIDAKTNQIWLPSGKDPKTGDTIYTTSAVDPKTGYVITIYGYLNKKTNEIERQTKLDPNTTKIDPLNGQIFTATGDFDALSGEPVYAASQVDPETGDVYTKVARVDPKTGKVILIKIILLTKKDELGKPQEVDPAACDIDPVSGRVRNIFSKTVYVYNMVDPVTGEVVQVDPNDPRVAGARTTVTQTMTLTGEIDPVTGRIKTEYGHIDPNTGDIDPETAVTDPVTGKLILNYAQIEPSHFGKEVTITEETVPITREQFYDGVKHLPASALRRNSEGGDDEDLTQYAQGKGGNGPTVVKTTTKQVMTRNEEGVTHAVEEEIRNLGTGEVTINTQESKVIEWWDEEERD